MSLITTDSVSCKTSTLVALHVHFDMYTPVYMLLYTLKDSFSILVAAFRLICENQCKQAFVQVKSGIGLGKGLDSRQNWSL